MTRYGNDPPCPRCGTTMHFSVAIPKTGHHDATLLFFRCSKCGRATTETRVSPPVIPDRAEAHAHSHSRIDNNIKLRDG